jgi:hypothetical protein
VFIDLTGLTFGYLFVEKFSHTDGKHRYWLCKCICEKEILVITANLKRGTSKSCGCMRGYLNALKTGIDPTELAYRIIYNDYKSRAKQKKFEFEFSFESFKIFISSDCYYCGSAPVLPKTGTNKLGTATIFYNGIDRKNNDIGYKIDNAVTCCKICNYAKKAMNYNDFIIWINKIKSMPFIKYA